MIVNLGNVSAEQPRAFVGSCGKETRRNRDEGKKEVRGTYAFTLLSAHSSEVEDVKSVSFHPIDEPLLESSTTTQTCPFRKIQKGKKNRYVDAQSRFSEDTLSVSDYSSIYISVSARDDCDVKAEDEKLPRTSSRRRLQLRNRRDSSDATSHPPTVLRLTKNGQESIGIPLATPAVYDMSACDDASNVAHPILASDDCDDEGLLLLPGSTATPRSRQLKPKFSRRRGRNLFPGLVSMHFQMKRTACFDTSIIYQKCRGKGLDAGLGTEPSRCQTLAARSVISRINGAKKRKGKNIQSHVPSLGFLDIQTRYKNAISKGNEISPTDEKGPGSSIAVDTLRAPLDAPLSTLYEDDDEDSEILSTVSSFFQLSAGRSQINIDYRRLHQPNSLYLGSSNPEETDDEGTLLGEKLLEVSTSENESTTSQGRSSRETINKVGDTRKPAYAPLCKDMLLERSDSASRDESEELNFRIDDHLQNGKVQGESRLVQYQTEKSENNPLPNQRQHLVQPASLTGLKKVSAGTSFQNQEKPDKKNVNKVSRHVNNTNRKPDARKELVPTVDVSPVENDLPSKNYVKDNDDNGNKRNDHDARASPAKGNQYLEPSTADDTADDGIFIQLNSSDISELTDCEFPDGAKSAMSRQSLGHASHEGKPDEIPERPTLTRTSGLRSLLKQPTYTISNKPLVTAHANLGRKSTKCKKYDYRKEREHKTNESSNFTHVQRSKHRKQASRYISEGITVDDCVDDDRQAILFSDDDDDNSDDPFAGLYCVSQLAV